MRRPQAAGLAVAVVATAAAVVQPLAAGAAGADERRLGVNQVMFQSCARGRRHLPRVPGRRMASRG